MTILDTMISPHGSHDQAEPQYAVVLVSQDQFDQLMHRPPMRRVNAGFAPHDVARRYQRLKRLAAGVSVFLLVLIGSGALWFLAPQPVMASMFPWSGASPAPALTTGASFSVTIASLESRDQASRAAARVKGQGFPVFTRRSPGEQQIYQAMVGPYASLDEAQRAKRQLGNLGFVRSRLFVDESLRSSQAAGPLTETLPGNPGVVLLGAPGRLSLVFEMPTEPRRVNSRRSTESAYDIDLGPMPTRVTPQEWSVPEGVHLMQKVRITGITAPDGAEYLRARVELPEFARTSLRAEGRMVYLDLTWPMSDDDVSVAQLPWAPNPADGAMPRPQVASVVSSAPEPRSEAPRAAAAVKRRDPHDEELSYREAIAPVHARLAEIRPFLLSSAESGAPEVFAALDQTLAAVEASAEETAAPPAAATQHQLLVSAIKVARQGLDPGFSGDRLAQAYQAMALLDGAVAASPVSPADQ